MEAAARILEEAGRDGLNTNAIAARAGVSIGSLYQYFPNKEAILATLVRGKRTDLIVRMRAAVEMAQDLSPEDAVETVIDAGMMHHYTRPRLTLELEAMETQLAIGDETRALSAEMADLVLDTLRRVTPAAGPQEAADVIAICKGLISAASIPEGADGPALVRRCRWAVLGYLDRIDSRASARNSRTAATPSPTIQAE
ncbi:TetR/AcrR family transcriptional regulator [Chachezhania sediminis]|uniref:TetR/AcrR family transcriptional regulator n=1 Tax=Chachezhania sediminis TaxID=2599291 RepID=UPI00131DB9A0|nr:TetR/AcrR family transcriptional regulator [Chachezhania sediminis]